MYTELKFMPCKMLRIVCIRWKLTFWIREHFTKRFRKKSMNHNQASGKRNQLNDQYNMRCVNQVGSINLRQIKRKS
jgi:hypothetical protein